VCPPACGSTTRRRRWCAARARGASTTPPTGGSPSGRGSTSGRAAGRADHDDLLDAELGIREERRVRTSLRLSGLPLGQTLANFEFSFQPSDRSRIETLATCAWIREGFTLLLQGPPGVGKTHLAVALGVKAVENGFSVAFFRLEELLLALKRDAELPPSRLRRRKYNNVALVIVDEVGFEVMSREEASLFFRLISYRYGRGSILITTNKGIRDWPEVLAGDEIVATAILDRLLHHSHVLNIK
jgi:DNA replication protein DnaC